MQNLFRDLTELLSKDDRLVSEGKLLKNKVIELALKMDSDLIKLLLRSKPIKKHFFADADGVLVFDKIKFQNFVSNKQFLPDTFTAFKNKIGLVNENGNYLSESKEVVLAWPYKDCVLEGGQTKEDQKRDEIFWNETLAPDEIDRLLAPKVFTNLRRYDTHGERQLTGKEEIDFSKQNLIVKGNNLLALHSLYKRFAGRIKLIYIDPPYNTGNDSFGYNDAFSRSTWLTFMKNRFEIAKELLSQDGAIVVQISDRQVGYLQVLMDEIFPEGFINKVAVETRSPSGFKTVNLGVFESAEYLLIYGKNRKLWKYNPQFEVTAYDENYSFQVTNVDEPCSKWKIANIKELVASEHGFKDGRKAKKGLGETVFLAELAQYALKNAMSVFRFTEINRDAGKDTLALKEISIKSPDKVLMVERENLSPRYILNGQEITFYDNKVRELDGNLVPTTMLTNIWTDIPWEGIAAEGNVKLKKGKKPERLLRRLIEMGTDSPNDIVLDFYLGSGTTAAVAHKMDRQYIGIEQLDYGENDSLVRLRNVIKGDQSGISKSVKWNGGGTFIYCELMKYNEAYIQRIHKAKTAADLLAIWKNMQEKAFISYKVEPKAINENTSDFEKLTIDEKKRLLIEILDKNQLYVNYSEMDDAEYRISETDKKLNRKFYEEG